MKVYTLTHDDLTSLCNGLLREALRDLVDHKEITAEQRTSIEQKYVVIVARKGFFGRWWDRMFTDQQQGNDPKIVFCIAKMPEAAQKQAARELMPMPEEP
jgi:hypothetical protein